MFQVLLKYSHLKSFYFVFAELRQSNGRHSPALSGARRQDQQQNRFGSGTIAVGGRVLLLCGPDGSSIRSRVAFQRLLLSVRPSTLLICPKKTNCPVSLTRSKPFQFTAPTKSRPNRYLTLTIFIEITRVLAKLAAKMVHR